MPNTENYHFIESPCEQCDKNHRIDGSVSSCKCDVFKEWVTYQWGLIQKLYGELS